MTMRIHLTVILVLLLTPTINAQTPPPINNFLVEHGTVEYETDRGKSILCFIERGNKFRQETFDNSGKLIVTEIYDGQSYYTINNGRIDTIGVIRNVYFRSANPDGYKRNREFKMLPSKTIAGKMCQGFEYLNTMINQKIVIYGWCGIQMQYSTEDFSNIAVKFDSARPTVSFNLE